MSNVLHSLPQVQNHLSSLRGDQPQSGQLMRGGPEAPGLLIFFKLPVWNDDRIVSDQTHAFCSLNSVFFAECAPISSDHAHFLPTESGRT